jgi:pantetheine-phosphate adenylyltransferase
VKSPRRAAADCAMPKRTQRRVAVYAGSFDPLTIGHLWMIEQGDQMFDRLIVAVGLNPGKPSSFSVEERLTMIRGATRHLPHIDITSFGHQFLINYARSVGATHILRGIRSAPDYEYERVMRNINGDLEPQITVVFLMPPRDIAEVSSSMVKGLIGPVGWKRILRKYVPPSVYRQIVGTYDDRGLRRALPDIAARPA